MGKIFSEKQELISRLKRWRSISKDAVEKRHSIWKQNELYYLSDQWSKDRIDRMAKWRSAPTYNIIFQTVELIHSLVTDQRPVAFSFNRAGGSVGIAQLISSILEQRHIDLDIEEKDSYKWKDKLIVGTSFWKNTWDTEQKDINTVRVAPENIFPDPLAEEVQDCRYFFHREIMPISDVVETYPDLFDEIVNSKDKELEGIFDLNTKQITRSAKVEVWECWFKDTTIDPVTAQDPSSGSEIIRRQRRYPRGRVVTFVGDVVLDDRKNPYKFKGAGGHWPFTKDILIKQRGEFWGISLVDIMKQQQDEVNQLEAMIFDNIKTVVNPIYVALKGAVDIESFSNAPGAFIEEDEPGAFRREPGINIASDVFRFRDAKVEELKQIPGVTDALQGSVGASQRPGAVRAAFEASMTRLREMIRNSNRALSDMGERQIDLMQQFYEVGRMVALSAPEDDVSDLSNKFNQEIIKEALNDERVMREIRAARQEKRIIERNPQFDERLEEERQNNPDLNDEKELRRIVKTKGIIEFKDDIRQGRYGYRVDVHSLQARDRQSFVNLVVDLLRYGNGTVVDAQAVWEWLDLPGKDRMIARINETERLRQENQQLQEQLAQLGQGGAQAPNALPAGGNNSSPSSQIA